MLLVPVVAMLLNVVLAFQPRVVRCSPQVMRSRATIMSFEGESIHAEQEPQEGHMLSVWKAMRTKLSVGTESLGKLVFGTGAAVVAGFGAPPSVDLMRAVKDGRQDMGTVLQSMVHPPSAEAFSLKPFSRRSLKEKLASVPCFLVCNQQGSPYLVPLETGFDVGVVFLDPADAEEMLQSMVQNPQTADARILVMGLDKGLELVQSEPRRNGNHMLVFQFCPSVQQLKNANGFRKAGWKAILDQRPDKWRFGFNRQGVRNAGLPVFYCPDLRIAKGREMVKPIFFSMEDLYYAWDRSTAGKHGAAPGDVKTLDLLRVVEWMLNEPEQTKLVGFHASTQAQDYVETQLRVKGGKSRPVRAS
ncbi:chloroplast inner membrane import protein tic22 [Nannochloropsis oceanica]